MDSTEVPLPRYDFYQTPDRLILSLYLKGYGAPSIKEDVKVDFQPESVLISLPSLPGGPSTPQHLSLDPLYASIKSDESNMRVLSSKLELMLAKAESINWPSLLASSTPITSSVAGPSTPLSSTPTPSTATETRKSETAGKKNWDRLVDEELDDGKTANSADPNAGGDAALQTLFSSIYSNADDDTRRAMIKSFTESGGTTLSTDWSSIGKEKTAVRPPDGMEARNYEE